MKKTFIISLLFFPIFLHSQILKVSVDKNPALVGEEILIQYKINTSAKDFKSPNFNGLQILSGPNPSTQTSYSFVNGKSQNSSSTTYSYYLKAVKEGTYNISPASITVDGETSTNDACVLMSTSASSHKFSDLDKKDKENFCSLLREVFIYLAQSIVRDGEGATKFITVEVVGAQSKEQADTVAYSIANSPLVKTAFFAQDPNWGRILSAAGKNQYDMGSLKIYICDMCVYDSSGSQTYDESALQKLMLKTDIMIRLDLGCGKNNSRIWTTDLSYDYIKINAEYRN